MQELQKSKFIYQQKKKKVIIIINNNKQQQHVRRRKKKRSGEVNLVNQWYSHARKNAQVEKKKRY